MRVVRPCVPGRTNGKNPHRDGRNDVRRIQYRNVLKPSVEYLAQCGQYMLATKGMAEFLGVAPEVVTYLAYTDRIPLPCKLGLGNCLRWNVLELLDWVEAGCPRRAEWIERRGASGWFPLWRW